jgi:hypothetical protein
MLDKIYVFLLKIYFAITPKDKSAYMNYHILSQDEFNVKGDQFELKEIIYSEHIETIQGLSNRIPTTNYKILRKPYFVCAQRKNDYIRDLKLKAYIGRKNFPLFDKIKQENDELNNQIIAYKHESGLQKKELQAKIKLLTFMKTELSEATYNKLVFKHEQLESPRQV